MRILDHVVEHNKFKSSPLTTQIITTAISEEKFSTGLNPPFVNAPLQKLIRFTTSESENEQSYSRR